MKRRREERAIEDGKPAGSSGSAGIMAAQAGPSDFGSTRIFTLNPCFSLPNSKCRQAHSAWGKMSNFRDKRSF